MIKDGLKTSEFWFSAVIALLGLLVAALGFRGGGWTAVAAIPAGCFQMGWAAFSYNRARALVKLNPALASALGLPEVQRVR